MSTQSAAEARRLALRSASLAGAGVRTPVGVYDEPSHEIVFPWIDGITGHEFLRRHMVADARRGWDRIPVDAFAELLYPLTRLHIVDPESLDLAHIDPWRRVDPRLRAVLGPNGDRAGQLLAGDVRRVYAAIKARFAASMARRATANIGLVHGDYHVGQVIFEPSGGEAWLLDLDDLALGPPESDLGNFAAHLATSNQLPSETPVEGFMDLLPILGDVYGKLARHNVGADLMEAYGAVALLRRALKLRELGADGERIAQIIEAASAAAAAGSGGADV